mmetsp:Transcript_3076/g.8696  ORF Transcript_3076/g.8696 Transcript_3076/m.8696 type:complete len:550 (-) Transcript_3076:536-2185(-)
MRNKRADARQKGDTTYLLPVFKLSTSPFARFGIFLLSQRHKHILRHIFAFNLGILFRGSEKINEASKRYDAEREWAVLSCTSQARTHAQAASIIPSPCRHTSVCIELTPTRREQPQAHNHNNNNNNKISTQPASHHGSNYSITMVSSSSKQQRNRGNRSQRICEEGGKLVLLDLTIPANSIVGAMVAYGFPEDNDDDATSIASSVTMDDDDGMTDAMLDVDDEPCGSVQQKPLLRADQAEIQFHNAKIRNGCPGPSMTEPRRHKIFGVYNKGSSKIFDQALDGHHQNGAVASHNVDGNTRSSSSNIIKNDLGKNAPPSPRSIRDVFPWNDVLQPEPEDLRGPGDDGAYFHFDHGHDQHASFQFHHENDNDPINGEIVDLSPTSAPLMPRLWQPSQSCWGRPASNKNENTGDTQPAGSGAIPRWLASLFTHHHARENTTTATVPNSSIKALEGNASNHSLRSCLRSGRFSERSQDTPLTPPTASDTSSSNVSQECGPYQLRDQANHDSQGTMQSVRFSAKVDVRQFSMPQQTYAGEGWSEWFGYPASCEY